MKRIFYVEDDLSLINGLSFAIKKQGYEIDIARTSSEAENLWMNGKYDLVILDVSLPDGSGCDLCKKIRQNSKVPILQSLSNWRYFCQRSMLCFAEVRTSIRLIQN